MPIGLKNALDRALALDPSLHDAYFGIGLYHYYAAVAPAAVKMLRWLLFLPGGDREGGLREMQRARDQRRAASRRSRLSAALALSLVRTSAGARARTAARTRCAVPSNPIFLRASPRSSATSFHDHAASARTWQTLLDRASAKQVEAADDDGVRARIGLAQELIEHVRRAARDRSAAIDRGFAAHQRRTALKRSRISCSDARTTRSAIAIAQSASGGTRDRHGTIRRSRQHSSRARAQRSREHDAEQVIVFDNLTAFVLDIRKFSTIIYIWYEGGELRPSLVRLKRHLTLPHRGTEFTEAARKVPRSDERTSGRVSVPGGSHSVDHRSARARQTHMKGGIKDNGKESQGREEEGRQETVS